MNIFMITLCAIMLLINSLDAYYNQTVSSAFFAGTWLMNLLYLLVDWVVEHQWHKNKRFSN